MRDYPTTGTDFQERHLYDACPLCGAGDFAHIFVGDCSKHDVYDKRLSPEIHWHQCNSCAHVFTEGYFTDEACTILFGKTHEHQRVGANIEANRNISARMIDRVLPYASAGRWMDVGFGNASLLFTAKEYGFHPIGVDLRRDNVEKLQQLGYEAYCQDLLALDLEAPCQVISLMDVLEHVPYPGKFLQAVVNLLDDGGVCFLSMPNTEQILWDVWTAQNINPYWGEIEHYHNFSRTRLYALLEEHGLQPVRYGVSERYRACMEVVAVKS